MTMMGWKNSLSFCLLDKLQEKEGEEKGVTNFRTLFARCSSLSPLEI